MKKIITSLMFVLTISSFSEHHNLEALRFPGSSKKTSIEQTLADLPRYDEEPTIKDPVIKQIVSKLKDFYDEIDVTRHTFATLVDNLLLLKKRIASGATTLGKEASAELLELRALVEKLRKEKAALEASQKPKPSRRPSASLATVSPMVLRGIMTSLICYLVVFKVSPTMLRIMGNYLIGFAQGFSSKQSWYVDVWTILVTSNMLTDINLGAEHPRPLCFLNVEQDTK